MRQARAWLLIALALVAGLAVAVEQGTTGATPQAPTLIAPADGATLSRFGVDLSWTVPAGATLVHWEVLPFNNDGPGLGLLAIPRGSFSIPAPPTWYFLLPDMTYTWRVRATDGGIMAPLNDPSWSPWSPPRTFRTPKVSSAGLAPVMPANGAVNVVPGPTVLQWSHPDPEIFYWEIQVSGDNRFDTDSATATSFVWWNLVHGGVSRPANSWTTPPLDPGRPYYWRVRPRIQGDGTPVAWSTNFSFQTGPSPSSLITFTVPDPLPKATVGQRYYFGFCNPHSGGPTEPCPSPGQAPINPAGGNPPYHFQKDPSSQFWPFGLNLGKDGQLEGVPQAADTKEFTVCAIDLSGNQACAKTTLEVIPAPPPLTAPTVTASTCAYADKIRVAWTAVASATSYNVYRNIVDSNVNAVLILPDANAGQLQFDDVTVAQGATYYYWVRAVAAGVEGAWSAGVAGQACAQNPPTIAITSITCRLLTRSDSDGRRLNQAVVKGTASGPVGATLGMPIYPGMTDASSWTSDWSTGFDRNAAVRGASQPAQTAWTATLVIAFSPGTVEVVATLDPNVTGYSRVADRRSVTCPR